MKYLKKIQAPLNYTLCASVILTFSNIVTAQEDVYVNVARFSILIETSEDLIKFTCSDGCAWKQLSFSSSINGEPQAVDQNGMTKIPGSPEEKESLLSDFLFTIRKTKEGVSLEGKKGTIWTSLTFDCDSGKCSRPIDGWGMVDPKKN